MQKGLSHKKQVVFLAMGKAKTTAKKYPKAIIISADTMVLFKGKIIGKPKTETEAHKMLKDFSGKSQSILTGIVVLDAASKKMLIACVETKLLFKKLSDKDIFSYIKTDNPYDKAGGYNLQAGGLKLIKKIEGDFTNNLGLPMGFVFNALQELGAAK